MKPDAKIEVLKVLKSYKKQKFEVVDFYDKQFGLTVNHFVSNEKNKDWFDKKVSNLPLSKKFYWSDKKYDLQSVTPITQKQFDNIIYVN